MDVLNYTGDKEGDVESSSLAVASFNLKYGVAPNTDLQLVFAPYLNESVKVAGHKETEQGNGDTIIRLKQNFLGNDGGPIAIGLMPFVKLPTAKDELGNDKVEGGLIFPVGLNLSDDWGMGFMMQVNQLYDEGSDNYFRQFISSLTVSHDIGAFGVYGEIYSESQGGDQAAWIATFDTGLTYGASDDLQYDIGVNIGLNDAADDYNPFIGVSYRI